MESHPISSRLPQPRVLPARDASKREEPGRRSADERRRRAKRWVEAEGDARGEPAAPAEAVAAGHQAPDSETTASVPEEPGTGWVELDARGRRLDIRV